MRKCCLLNFLALCFFLGNYQCSFAQTVNSDKESYYQQVFIKTDNFGASYLDSLENRLKRVKSDSLYFTILNDLAYYWHTRNLKTALNFTKNGLNRALAKDDTLWQGRFQITQGAILLRMEKLDSAYLVLEDAKQKVYEKDLPFLNTQLGYVFERKGEIDRAADYALESLQLGEKLKDDKAIALAYSDLSNLFWKQSKYVKGLEYGLKSIEIFEQRGINDLDYDFTLYVVGNNYLELRQYDKALKFYEHSIAIGERYGFYNNLSDVYISLVDLYAYLGQFEKAHLSGVNAIKYAKLLDNDFMLMRSWLSVGKLQNLQGKYESAISSLQRCIEIATADFGDEFYLNQAYDLLGKAYAGNHQYKEAYAAFEKYDKLKNQIFTAEADQRISLLQTEFEVAQKETTIGLQRTKLNQQRAQQTFVLIIAGLLLILLIVLYKTFQNNRKKNKLLERQNQEKEFLLKEIHHRVKNNLEIVSSLLALQSARINDPNVIEAMKETQNRVHSMSMIHQKLYQGKNLATIEMKDYFTNLGNYIVNAFGAHDRIEVVCKMKELELDIDIALPVGLIVNELLTNALKHAFPENEQGKVIINIKEVSPYLILEVSDNGVGQIEKRNVPEQGFGTQLIQLLTHQLDGKMTQNLNQGTSVSFKFYLNKAA